MVERHAMGSRDCTLLRRADKAQMPVRIWASDSKDLAQSRAGQSQLDNADFEEIQSIGGTALESRLRPVIL